MDDHVDNVLRARKQPVALSFTSLRMF